MNNMKFYLLIFLSFLTIYLSEAKASNQKNGVSIRAPGDKVRVGIYYENLNVASRKFFVDEFKPVLDKLWDIIELDFVPYGNTTRSGDGNDLTFECPYGDKQCFANRIQSCAIGLRWNATDIPESRYSISHFIYCIFKNREAADIYDIAPHCTNVDFPDFWPNLDICHRGPEGNEYYSVMADKTASISQYLTNIPVVTINDVVSTDAVNNLLKSICEVYEPFEDEEPPAACNNTEKAPKVNVTIYYENLDTPTRNYFRRQIGPFYHLIEELVDIDFVPYGNTITNSSDGNNEFICSVGGREQCIANKIQALVVKEFLQNPPNGDEVDGVNRAVNFITCMFASNDWDHIYNAGEYCSDQTLPFDSWIHFLIEARDPATDWVVLEMRDRTAQFGSPLPNLPFVTIEGTPSVSTVNDFIQEVCALYTGDKPDICTKIEVHILYETLHHASRLFFIEEMKAVFDNFQSLINMKFLPAGRAHIDHEEGGHGIVCPGGEIQCQGNMLQACVIDMYYNDGANWTDPMRQEVFDFLHCMAKNRNAMNVWDSAESCAEEFIEVDPWRLIYTCYINEGPALLDIVIQETQSLGLNITELGIPIVTIDGNASVEAVTDLMRVICDHFDYEHTPDRCYLGKARKLEIVVYYEAFSEFSRKFITKQLAPYYKYIEELVNITLIPVGNVDSGNLTGLCPAGNNACIANKIQAVVLERYWLHDDDSDEIDGSIRSIQFLNCVFSHPNWTNNVFYAGELCVDQYLPIDEWIDIIVAVNGPEGTAIYADLQRRTQQLKEQLQVDELSPIPWVTLDGRHSLRMANDLLQAVCDTTESVDKPPECTTVNVEIYYESLNALSRTFFLEELKPTFDHIREQFVFDLIPYGRTNQTVIGNDTLYVCPSIDSEEQCFSHKLQACAISHFLHSDEDPNSMEYDGRNQTLMYVWCMFKNEDNHQVTDVAEACANQIFLEDAWIWEILLCARGPEGDDLIRQMAAKTGNIVDPLEHVPWIVINGARSADAQSNLQKVICDAYQGEKPVECYATRAPKVNVELHYQTGSTADRNYILNELYPNYRSLEEIINLDLVPFGQTNAVQNTNGSWSFTCPNGPNECIANRIHACVYSTFWDDVGDDAIDGKLQTLEFIRCYFNHPNWQGNPWDAAEICINENFIDLWTNILICARDPIGEGVLGAFRDKVNALRPPLTYTPWITVNGLHSQSAELHFTRTICDAYTGEEKPWLCYAPITPLDKPLVEIHYEPLNVLSRRFVLQQLNPLITHIEEITILDIVPYGRAQRTGNETDATFQCTNSTDNCHTTREHACIMNHFLQNFTVETLNFLVCAFGRDDWLDPAIVTGECLNENFLDVVPEIEVCARNGESTQILNGYADRVALLNPPLSHVPWILINGAHSVAAEENLIQEICDTYYPTDKPAQCIVQLVPVSIYYQTVSAPVANFVLQNIDPHYQYLDSISIPQLVPYGLTTRNATGFTCPQGESQCEANRIHACINHYFFESNNETIQIDNGRILTLQWLNCSFSRDQTSNPNPVQDAEQCLNQVFQFDYWSIIALCARGPEGDSLFAQLADLTSQLQPAIDYVPVVTLNTTRSQAAETNLVQAICDYYTPLRPTYCKTLTRETVAVGIYYSALDSRSRTFILNQLKPFYVDVIPVTRAAALSNILTVDFVPWGLTNLTDNEDDPFTCSGGTNDCFLTRIHACAINQYINAPNGFLQVIQFIVCTLEHQDWSTNPGEAGNVCANNVLPIDSWPSLDVCARLEPDVFLGFRNRTLLLSPPLNYVPWITINGNHSTAAENSLLSVVCNAYQGVDKPDECFASSSPTPSTITAPTASPPTTPSVNETSTMPTTTPAGASLIQITNWLLMSLLFIFLFV